MWSLLILAATPYLSQATSASFASNCKASNDTNVDCYGALFLQTDGTKRACVEHSQCYDYREPIKWCRLKMQQRWTQEGCHCDLKLNLCVMNRYSDGRMEYAHCRLASNWYCP